MNEENLTAKNDEPFMEDLQKENIIRREVKTYVLRIGRMTDAQERSYNELSPVWCIPFENKKLKDITDKDITKYLF